MVEYIDYYDAPFEDDIGSIESLLSAKSKDLYEEFDAQLQTVRDQLDVLVRETEDEDEDEDGDDVFRLMMRQLIQTKRLI